MRRPYNGSFPLTRPFGEYDPVAYANYPNKQHPGADYGLPANTPLFAAISGRVTVFDRDASVRFGRGKEVVITNGAVVKKECHMNRIDVANGQWVNAGDPIGVSGNTGYVLPVPTPQRPNNGAHLHSEVLTNGTYVDPEVEFQKGANDMSTVGEVEFNNLYRAFFGSMDINPPTEHDRKRWVGTETNTVVRAMEADPRRAAHDAYVADLAQTTGAQAREIEALKKQVADLEASATPPAEATVLKPGTYKVEGPAA